MTFASVKDGRLTVMSIEANQIARRMAHARLWADSCVVVDGTRILAKWRKS